ncbi:hypothetical protein DK389_26270 [Methylobacterium durans]|uniref:Uncharacterized protein n=2 Tax=Methylobacterium durans TaxID=2202825 RepID=A0A2U8WHQ7_9HYPH|nr:hypothetical protein DK389_26270 [Methylobacterium durans]
MAEPFCTIVIASGVHQVRITGSTERSAANAADTILRRLEGTGLNVVLRVECRDSAAGQRITSYLVDVAAEIEVMTLVERQSK